MDYEMKQKKQTNAKKLIAALGPETMPTDPLTIASPRRTQDGLGKAIGKRRDVVCQELKKLEQKGIIEKRLAHINGSIQRLCYWLTPAGAKEFDKIDDEIKNLVEAENEKPIGEILEDLQKEVNSIYNAIERANSRAKQIEADIIRIKKNFKI